MKKEDETFEHGVALFNAGQFFEAHETWEEIWLAENGPEKTFLQGLIQVAAAFHHAQRGNPAGMRSLLAAGLAKLAPFAGVRRGIAIEELCEDVQKCAERLAAEKDPKAKSFPTIARPANLAEEEQRERTRAKTVPPRGKM
jgi:uncharacterized protein